MFIKPRHKHTNGKKRTSCRDYQSTITVDGKDQVVHGTACRQPDGSWAAKK